MAGETTTNKDGLTAHRSRWGWHEVSYADYLSLKRMKKEFFVGLRLAAAWERWERKLPKNRRGDPPPPMSGLHHVLVGGRRERGEAVCRTLAAVRLPKASPDEVSKLAAEVAGWLIANAVVDDPQPA